MPGLVIGSYVSGMSFKPEEKLEMIRYLMNRAHPEDGGWGLWVSDIFMLLSAYVLPSHVEGQSTVFGTALNYAAIRILGMDKEHPVCVKARATLHKLGSCIVSDF